MTGGTLADAPIAVSHGRGYGGHMKIDRDGPYAIVVFGLLSLLVLGSFFRFLRRRRRWQRRQHVKRYERPDDPRRAPMSRPSRSAPKGRRSR